MTVVRVGAIVVLRSPPVWNNAKFVAFAIIYDLTGQMQLLRKKVDLHFARDNDARIARGPRERGNLPEGKCVAVLTFPYP